MQEGEVTCLRPPATRAVSDQHSGGLRARTSVYGILPGTPANQRRHVYAETGIRAGIGTLSQRLTGLRCQL